jgi:hypothetical protein
MLNSLKVVKIPEVLKCMFLYIVIKIAYLFLEFPLQIMSRVSGQHRGY